MSESPQLPDNLRRKFPNLRPIKRAPTLMRINGIGTGMYGHRDLDGETGTYVKTHSLCFIFVPILALAAYRVADAEHGWYFIGKERLSSFAKSCNFGVLFLSLILAGVIAEHAHKSSPDYRAGQELRRADEALKSGKPFEAARLYREVAIGATSHAGTARGGLRDSLECCLTNDSPEKVEAAFRLLAALPKRLNSPPMINDPYQRGLALVDKFRGSNPDGALGVLRQVALLGPTNAAGRSLEIDLLKASIAAKPNQTNRVVELALIYEDQQQMSACYELLSPHRQILGATEGARILGQHLLAEGQHGEAYSLLHPYVQARLDQLHAIERRYTNALASASRRYLQDLEDGRGDPSFYAAYKKASKAEKEAIVDAYIVQRMKVDAAVQRAAAELTSANEIVHVTLDLGMVQLNRAQTLADPAARKAELEAAEKTFLAIHGIAGDTDEYRLFLGQVYYWLGRSGEGKDLFDQLLAKHNRASPVLVQLAGTLREVGEESQARDLADEAYRTAKSDKEKFHAASMRAHLQKDIDDKIAWLEKCNPAESNVQISLNDARGRKALDDGNREQAAQFFRRAIDGYQNAPRSSALLNNCGLVHFNLYAATGNLADHDRGLALLEEAVALDPGQSVLLMNISHLLITRAYMDMVGGSIHFAALKESPNQAMLAHLYKEDAARATLIRQLQENPHMKKALAYLDKALLLAPKNPHLYALAIQSQETFRDGAELQKLQQRLRIAAPDAAELTRDTRQAYDPAKDKERLDRFQHEISRYQALVQDPAVTQHPLTLEFAEVELNGLSQAAGYSGARSDSRALLEQAAATYQRQPTWAGLGVLTAAHFYRAHDQLRQQDAVYAKLAEQTRRALAPRALIAVLVDRNDSLAAAIRQNPEFRKAIDLVKEAGRLCPSCRQPDEWALFHTVNADETAVVVRQLKDNSAARLADDLLYQLNPIGATTVLQQFWTAKFNGNTAAATALYQQALRDGVPLPPL